MKHKWTVPQWGYYINQPRTGVENKIFFFVFLTWWPFTAKCSHWLSPNPDKHTTPVFVEKLLPVSANSWSPQRYYLSSTKLGPKYEKQWLACHHFSDLTSVFSCFLGNSQNSLKKNPYYNGKSRFLYLDLANPSIKKRKHNQMTLIVAVTLINTLLSMTTSAETINWKYKTVVCERPGLICSGYFVP